MDENSEDELPSRMMRLMEYRVWEEDMWYTRREQLADVWDQHDKTSRKKILGMLVAHAPEADVSD